MWGARGPSQVLLIHRATGNAPTRSFNKKEVPNRRTGSFHTEEGKRWERTAGVPEENTAGERSRPTGTGPGSDTRQLHTLKILILAEGSRCLATVVLQEILRIMRRRVLRGSSHEEPSAEPSRSTLVSH